MATIPERKRTIIRELIIENQWIWSSFIGPFDFTWLLHQGLFVSKRSNDIRKSREGKDTNTSMWIQPPYPCQPLVEQVELQFWSLGCIMHVSTWGFFIIPFLVLMLDTVSHNSHIKRPKDEQIATDLKLTTIYTLMRRNKMTCRSELSSQHSAATVGLWIKYSSDERVNI